MQQSNPALSLRHAQIHTMIPMQKTDFRRHCQSTLCLSLGRTFPNKQSRHTHLGHAVKQGPRYQKQIQLSFMPGGRKPERGLLRAGVCESRLKLIPAQCRLRTRLSPKVGSVKNWIQNRHTVLNFCILMLNKIIKTYFYFITD